MKDYNMNELCNAREIQKCLKVNNNFMPNLGNKIAKRLKLVMRIIIHQYQIDQNHKNTTAWIQYQFQLPANKDGSNVRNILDDNKIGKRFISHNMGFW